MATIFQPNEDENTQQSGISSGNLGMGGGQTPVKREQRGSGLVPNLQKYLQANTGGAQQIASGIQKGAQQQADQVQKGVTQAQQQFQEKTQPLEQQLGEQGQQLIQTAFKNPQEILQQQQQLQQFQQLRDQGFQSQIQGLTPNINPLQQQTEALQQNVQLAGTEPGRFQLLQRSFGQPSYNKGQQSLDQLLLQATPSATRNLQQQLQQYQQQAGQQVNQLSSEAQAKQSALQQLSGQRSQEIQNLLQSGASPDQIEASLQEQGLGDIQQSLEQRLQQVQQTDPQSTEQLRQRLSAGQLTQQDLQTLGLSAGQNLYDVNLADYITQGNRQATIAGISTPEQYARYQALQQLTGDQTSGGLFGGVQEEDIGTYKPYEYNLSGAQEAIKQREQEYQNFLNQNLAGMQAELQRGGRIGGGTGMAEQLTPEQLDAKFGNNPEKQWMRQQYELLSSMPKSVERDIRLMALNGYAPQTAGLDYVNALQAAQQNPNNFQAIQQLYERAQPVANEFAKYTGVRDAPSDTLKDFLNRFQNYQAGRTLQVAPEDLESSQNFGIS